MLLPFFLVLLKTSVAAGPAPVGPSKPLSLEEYILDLQADYRSDRLFAARELRRRVRHATRVADSRPGSLRSDEARQDLMLYDQLLAPQCTELIVTHRELRGPCADILGLLRTDAALSAIEDSLELDDRGWVRRRLTRAAGLIRSSQSKPGPS